MPHVEILDSHLDKLDVPRIHDVVVVLKLLLTEVLLGPFGHLGVGLFTADRVLEGLHHVVGDDLGRLNVLVYHRPGDSCLLKLCIAVLGKGAVGDVFIFKRLDVEIALLFKKLFGIFTALREFYVLILSLILSLVFLRLFFRLSLKLVR